MRVTAGGLVLLNDDNIFYHEHLGEYELYYHLKGQGVFVNGDRETALEENTLYLSVPKQLHNLTVRDTGSFYFIRFTADRSEESLMAEIRAKFNLKGNVRAEMNSMPVFEDIIRKFETRNRHLAKSANHQMLSFIYELASEIHGTRQLSTEKYANTAIKMMEENIYAGINLDKLSKDLGLNKSYFIRLFKKTKGVTPMRYFLRLKMDAACYMLRNTELKIYNISEKLNFYDEFHFSRLFKSFVGKSPEKYRKTAPFKLKIYGGAKSVKKN
jgi:AraC-like DNA-binding protein